MTLFLPIVNPYEPAFSTGVGGWVERVLWL